jgi:hypothetical protein
MLYFLSAAPNMAARSKAYACGRSLSGIACSNTAGGMDVCLLWVLCFVRERSLWTGWSLIQRRSTDCDVSKLNTTMQPRNWRDPGTGFLRAMKNIFSAFRRSLLPASRPRNYLITLVDNYNTSLQLDENC